MPALGEKIYVFCPGMAKPNAVQAVLGARLQGDEVTVFGRLADFTAMVESTSPDVIIAPRPLVEQFPSFRTFLRGTRKGTASEAAVLVSVRPLDPGALPELRVGVVGILPRPAMNGLAQSALGGIPHLKIVTKLEDLLPLLTFGSADAVLVGESQAEELRSRSQAALRTAGGAGRMPLVVVAARGDSQRAESALRSLGPAERRMLGVDGWAR